MTHLCQECGDRFPRPNPRGRPPLYCSDACKREAKRRIDGKPTNPKSYRQCCIDAGNRQCPQHHQWKAFARQTRRRPKISNRDAEILQSMSSVDLGEDAYGTPVRQAHANPGFFITSTP